MSVCSLIKSLFEEKAADAQKSSPTLPKVVISRAYPSTINISLQQLNSSFENYSGPFNLTLFYNYSDGILAISQTEIDFKFCVISLNETNTTGTVLTDPSKIVADSN